MSNQRPSRLRFNFGFLLEADFGSSRIVELNYPSIRVADDVILSPLRGAFTATRISEGVYISGVLESSLSAECVRCLEEAIVPLVIELDELFYYPPATAPAGENVMGDDGFIDLAPLVRELSLLAMPMRVLCRDDCQGLCQECGQNLNFADCGCVDENIDPRLAGLRLFLD